MLDVKRARFSGGEPIPLGAPAPPGGVTLSAPHLPPTPGEVIGGCLARMPRPEHPGRVFRDEFLEPTGLLQRTAARMMGMSYPRLNEIVNGKRSVIPDTALRFARFTGTPPEFWLEFQLTLDLWKALTSPSAAEVLRIRPLIAHRIAADPILSDRF